MTLKKRVKSVFVLDKISIFHWWKGGTPNLIRIPKIINLLPHITSCTSNQELFIQDISVIPE